MSAGAFDTLTAARDLEAAGFERRKAEAIAAAINNDRSPTVPLHNVHLCADPTAHSNHSRGNGHPS